MISDKAIKRCILSWVGGWVIKSLDNALAEKILDGESVNGDDICIECQEDTLCFKKVDIDPRQQTPQVQAAYFFGFSLYHLCSDIRVKHG